ncbi:MAG: ABC transporter ATP-binding protein [Actinomycetota bacterium]
MTDVPGTPAVPLQASALRKTFDDVVALDGVSLELHAGEVLALVGPSGCGKSTFLRSVAGLVELDAGAIELDGTLVDDGSTQLPPEQRSVGLVFQEHALFPHLTVADNIGFGIRNSAREGITSRVDEMLDLVNLAGYGGRFPHELSGGERQRVALARALAPRPALMLLDEPFASLDHNLRVALRHEIMAALRATGTPAIFVTHDQAEALMIGDRIAVMRSGCLEQLDAPAAIFHRPANRFVASFMGAASFLPIEDPTSSARTVLGAIDSRVDCTSPVAMVRPDDLRFDVADSGSAEVVTAEYHGSGWLVTVRHDSGPDLLVALEHLDTPHPGQRGDVSLVPGHRQVIIPDHAP